MDTRFGTKAKEGDYVLVLDNDYVHRRSANYIGRVYKNKVYTGIKMVGSTKDRYIHKLTVEIVIPESIVPEETKQRIEADIQLHNKEENKNGKI